MQVLRFNTPYPVRLSLALGFFDCAHLGHRAILRSAAESARETNAIGAAFTFDNDPFAVLGQKDKLIYTFGERVALLAEIGVQAVVAAAFSKEFMRLPADAFLETLTKSFDVAALACGPDYTYGFGGGGDAAGLSRYCALRGIPFRVVPFVTENGVKVSSTAVREFLQKGDVEAANLFLGAPYSARGRVERGRALGRRLSYPTANLPVPSGKLRIKDGVYATRTAVGGAVYASVTNAGGKPTFGIGSYGIETHLLDYNKDLYGRDVKVEFLRYMRPVQTFGGPDALRAQLDADAAARRAMEEQIGN
jgi:riboflavin kinase/FMN adenylyltransferase